MKTKNNINLKQAQAGQILALDVIDLNGNCLMSEGVVLSDKTISSLLQRGIDAVVVWGLQINENEIALQQSAIKERLAQRFRQVQNNPEMCQLHDILLRWRLQVDEAETDDS
ncbi:hypothetical protein MNBD_GAMMA22-1171 [hydrothermal vent metagenome]|uniref:Uncharacterized protein n=1 Tax=hydrothermal vent metagenome TaxID=652676 RepID=A0A3B0ZX38_9ZZZZ